MCHHLDSRPPVAPLAGAAVGHSDLVLEPTDGNRFAAFEARPADPSGAGIVILPDVRGLHRFYEELALRFAERGHRAIAIDYYGRTAGVAKRGEDFDYPGPPGPAHPRRRADRSRGGAGAPPLTRGWRLHVPLHGRLLLRRRAVVACRRWARGALGRDRLLRTARRDPARS